MVKEGWTFQPSFYIKMHNILVKKFGLNIEVTKKEAAKHMMMSYNVPYDLRYIIIKEMVMYKMLSEVNSRKIIIKPIKFHYPEVNINRLCESIGIYKKEITKEFENEVLKA